MIKLNTLKKGNKERYERNMPHLKEEIASLKKTDDGIMKIIENWQQLGYVDREENSPSAETAPALRTPLISDKLENAMNLPSPAEIRTFAQEKGIPLIMPNAGVTPAHESPKSQKQLEKKVENEGMPEVPAAEPSVNNMHFAYVRESRNAPRYETPTFSNDTPKQSMRNGG